MASYNKVLLVGRLTREPEITEFKGGGKVAKFGFAVNDRRKTAAGEWEDDPMFVDVDAFSGPNNNLADRVAEGLKKGSQILLEGQLKLDKWQDKTSGQSRSKHGIKMLSFQFLDAKKQESGVEGSGDINREIGATDDPNDIIAAAGMAGGSGKPKLPF